MSFADWIERQLDTVVEHPFLTAAAVLSTVIAAEVLHENSSAVRQSLGNEAEQTRTLNSLKAEKEALEKKQQQRNGQTQDYLNEARNLLKDIQDHRHEFFLPGHAADIQDSIQQVEDHVSKGRESAAHVESLHACQTARTTLSRLLTLEIEWEETWQALTDRIDALNRFSVRYNARVHTSAGDETVTLDLDYWTGDRLQRLRGQIPTPHRDLSAEELRGQIQQAETLLEQMERLPEAALAAFLDACLRKELCEAVYQALLDRGWALAGGNAFGFENNDERRPAFLRMKDAVGDSISFTFAEERRFHASISLQKAGDRSLREHLAGTLRRSLSESGFVLTEFQVLDD